MVALTTDLYGARSGCFQSMLYNRFAVAIKVYKLLHGASIFSLKPGERAEEKLILWAYTNTLVHIKFRV